MASDLEVLILIPAVSHSAANRPGHVGVPGSKEQQYNIVCEKQRRSPVAPEPEPLRPLAAPRNSVHKNNEQNR